MRTINVLTEGFKSPNGISFISPLIIFQKYLLGKDINVNFYSNLNKKIENCEVLLVEKVSSLKQDGKIKLMRYCNFSKSGKKRKLN